MHLDLLYIKNGTSFATYVGGRDGMFLLGQPQGVELQQNVGAAGPANGCDEKRV
jgi:hypothetical protein